MGSNPSLSRHPYAPSFHEWGEKNALALLGNFDTSSFRAPPFLFSSQIPVEIAGDVIPELIAIPRGFHSCRPGRAEIQRWNAPGRRLGRDPDQ